MSKATSVLISIILVMLLSSAQAQVHERGAFSFLLTPTNARMAALGGVNVSLADKDPNFFFSNPSLGGDTLAGLASANYQFYVADIGQASFSYVHNFKSIGVVSFGVQHLNYGKITSYDETGQEIGEVDASSTSLVAGRTHQIGNFRLGINAKIAFSTLAQYRASALLADIGGLFVHPDMDLRAGIVIKNVGVVLSDYTSGSETKLPFDVQAGFSVKPEHMPFRFSLTAYRLTNRALVYENNTPTVSSPVKDALSRINAGVEILLHRNVNVLVGYNYQRHQELKLQNGGGSAGISYGFSVHVKALDFVFSRATYTAGSAAYGFSLIVNMNKIF